MADLEEKLDAMKIEDQDSELILDLSMKKKKKKSKKVEEDVEETQDSQEAAPAGDDAAPAEEDPMAMFGDLKKKKKKKVKTEEDGAAPAGEEPADGATESFDFGDLKKKKKKKKVDFSAFEDGQEQGGEDGARDADDPFAEDDSSSPKTGAAGGGDAEESWIGTTRDYTYTELLSRVFKILRQNNPDLAGDKKRYTIVPPSVMRDGNKKTIFANVADICKRMRRPPEHVIQFLFAELGTSGSIDGSQRLVIKGRFQQKQIEAVLRRYIVEYVTCKTCKSPDTMLDKENRLSFVVCQSCGSTRSVSAIKSGFQAQTGKRAAQRARAAA